MADQELAAYNVIAAFRNLDEAGTALDSLKDAGIEESELSLVTREDPSDLQVPSEQEDDGTADAKKVVGGLGGGALAGGTVGALAGLAVVGLPGVGVAAGAGALFAAAGGGALGAQSTAGEEEWKERIGPLLGMVDDGHVLVGAHVEDSDRADRAAEVLHEHDPARVEEIRTAGGRPDAV